MKWADPTHPSCELLLASELQGGLDPPCPPHRQHWSCVHQPCMHGQVDAPMPGGWWMLQDLWLLQKLVWMVSEWWEQEDLQLLSICHSMLGLGLGLRLGLGGRRSWKSRVWTELG